MLADTLVTLDPQGTTFDLVAVKDGLAPWATVPLDAGVYAMHVHGNYVIATVCDPEVTGFSPFVEQFGRTTLEDEVTANWSFDYQVTPGTHDAAAISADAIELRRGLAISVATALTPAFDTLARGVALVPTGFAATNATTDETVEASVLFRTAGSRFFFPRGAPADVKLVPESIFAAGDANSVSIQAQTPASGRFLRRDFHTGDPTAFTLPPVLEPATTSVDGPRLIVDLPIELPTLFDVGQVTLIPTNSDPGITFDFSPSYAGTDADKIVFDQDIPGMQPQWKTDVTQVLDPSLFVQHLDGGDLVTQTSDLVTAAAELHGRAARSGRRTRTAR